MSSSPGTFGAQPPLSTPAGSTRKASASATITATAVFANQSSIETLPQLQQFTQRFASAHSVALPFAIDPQGRLAAAVQADNALGMRTGVTLTPTIFIVIANSKGAPYIEVRNPQADLFTTIDQALAETRSAVPAKTAHK